MIGKVFGWLAGKAALYAMLVVAIAVGTVVVPWIRQAVDGGRSLQVRAEVLASAARTIESESGAAASAFRGKARSFRSQTIETLDEQKRRLVKESDDLEASIGAAKPAWMLAITDQDALLAVERQKLRVVVIEQELAAIAAARHAAVAGEAGVDLAAWQRELWDRNSLCDQAKQKEDTYEQDWRWKLRSWWDNDQHKKLVATSKRQCPAAAKAKAQLDKVARKKAGLDRRAAQAAAKTAGAAEVIRNAGAGLTAEAERARVAFSGSLPERLRAWSERWKLAEILRSAAIALALIVATPYLIRLLCYFGLAPLAMRRPAIRIRVPGGRGVAIPPAAPSATSVAVRLEPGEELLVRQDYLQTSSHAGAKATQWWLDATKPITSMASGLVFLTRIRGDGEVTTVSAVRDSLAEVTILTLPDGAACVLQPRALAAVAQPIGRRLRITRHWRLGSLNAWLTLQLRYLVFHGPARLVLKGGRGVRVEAAEQGRVFGQDQLVGFSADLAYSVTRAETFWPYLLGREPLFKDRVMAGEGMLIIEEAPLAARRGELRRGLEGMIDAGMKVFGM